ncbi:hypothetical protein [Nonomuraea polychroma]|nr:hypothetical protein [Nonomuraea polychroma]
MILRLLGLFALVAAVVVVTSTAAHACDCADLTPAAAKEHAEVVFTGTVVEVRRDGTQGLGPPTPAVYTFRADNVYKGAPAAGFTVSSNVDTASCGYPFQQGTRYLVFARSDTSELIEKVPGVTLASSLCAGNVPIDQGTGPLRPGDERTPGHESLAGPVDAEMVTALGAPVRVAESASSGARTGTSAAARGLGWGWIAAGSAVVVLALAVGFALVRRRRAGGG